MLRSPYVLMLVSVLLLAGCDPLEVGKFAESLDKLNTKIDKTTVDGGNLDRRIKQLTQDMRKELVASGKEVTEDAVAKFALARKEMIGDILVLTKKIFGDTRVLFREFHGAGVSIALQIDDTLQSFPLELRDDLAQIAAAIPFLVKENWVPISFSGLDWTIRSTGYYSLSFTIPNANKLQLKLNGTLIKPEFGGTQGKVTFQVPIDREIKAKFQDKKKEPLPFLLVDENEKVRYGGLVRLQPRFPVEYLFKVYPADGNKGYSVVIDSGIAIEDIVRTVSGQGACLARRHGDIYRLAKSRLAFGTSVVEIPEGADWELKVKFPDGKTEMLQPNKRRIVNELGSVTVHGPNRKERVWTLQFDVEGKK